MRREATDSPVGSRWWVVLVVGIPLTAMAHFVLRRVRRQSIHIAVFAVIGLIAGLLVAPLGGTFWSGTTVLVALATGVSTAVGRAVVNRRPR